ncbi:MAG: tRNA preQ1(34) S-adenosylmethionine ribosyltransferase-isomerase QueA [Pirellulales bacterium]
MEELLSELDAYDYQVPRNLIAQHPLPNRSDARLMVVDRAAGQISHRYVRDLVDLLSPSDCLVLNDTKVLPARLVGRRVATGGRWQGLFVEADAEGNWHLLCKTRGKQSPGDLVMLLDHSLRDFFRLRMIEKLPGGMWAARPETSEDPPAIFERIGRVPLPDYIRRTAMSEQDRARYQTVFAREPGAVAAPTAGLHFTRELLAELQRREVAVCRVTLHVGLGTFRPIKTERLADHRMHAEWGRIEAPAVETIGRIRAAGGRIVAVGTTVVRVLETAAASGELRPWSGRTELFIRPPYEIRAVDALMTNFHVPRSTLLVLVRTFGGDELVRRAYEEAIRDEYRFFSYGDAMLIL